MGSRNVINTRSLGARYFWARIKVFARRPGAQNYYLGLGLKIAKTALSFASC